MSSHWMPLYIGDYLKDTRRLSTLEHGAYLLLIMDYWSNGGLPDDDRKLARIVGLPELEWLEIRDNIAEYFDDGWRHSRIEAEMAKSGEKTDRRKEAGRRGGLAKARNNPSNAKILPEQKDSNALASSTVTITDNTLSSASALERDFRFAICDEYTRAGFLAPDTGRCVIWIQNGWQKSICVETVRALLAKKGKALPLTYIEPAIADAHAPVPIGSPANQRAGPRQSGPPPSMASQILKAARQAGSLRNVRPDSAPTNLIIDASAVAREAG